MLKTLKKAVILILALLGVLFIAIMLMPDDEETDEASDTVAVQEATSHHGSEETAGQIENITTDNSTVVVTSAAETIAQQEDASVEVSQPEQTSNSNSAVTVSIPASELSDKVLKFRTVSLDEDIVTQDIFSKYDITVVHIWGTFCRPCIAEMGDYASYYKELPSNVNLVGLICDVYDGIDSNVSDAKGILSDAGAEFLNLRTSDDLYDLIGSLQYTPSAFFVDKEGHIIGEIMDGARFPATKERLEGYLK